MPTNTSPVSLCEAHVKALRRGFKVQHTFLARPHWHKRLHVGHRLWVREAYRVIARPGHVASLVQYAAGGDDRHVGGVHARATSLRAPPFLQPNTMIRELSRLTLRVTDVRHAVLHDLTATEHTLEGCVASGGVNFVTLWDALHPSYAERYAKNPAVYVIRFDLIEQPVEEIMRRDSLAAPSGRLPTGESEGAIKNQRPEGAVQQVGDQS